MSITFFTIESIFCTLTRNSTLKVLIEASVLWVSFCIGSHGRAGALAIISDTFMARNLWQWHGKNGFEVVKINIRAMSTAIIFGRMTLQRHYP